MAKLRITQIRSKNGETKRQIANRCTTSFLMKLLTKEEQRDET